MNESDKAIAAIAKAYKLPLVLGGQDQRVEETMNQAYLSGQGNEAMKESQ